MAHREFRSGYYIPTISTTNNRFDSGQGYSYDSSGNTTADAEGRTFVYDAENKQVEVIESSVTIGEYFYDGDGKRVKKIAGSEETIFVYDAGGKLIREHSTIVQTGGNAKTVYTTNDHLGSPRINIDGVGAVIARHDYHPFGEEIATTARVSGLGYTSDTIRKQFTGYERDGETNLDFAEARYYASGFGRFSSADDVLMASTPSIPQSWNLYRYGYNNPMRFVDPSGALEKENGKVKTRKRREEDAEDQSKDIKIGGKTFRKFAEATVNGKEYAVIGEVQKVWVYGEATGERIKAYVGVGTLKLLSANAQNMTDDELQNVKLEEASDLADRSHDSNCHGTSFGEGQVWINDGEIPKLLKADGYSPTNAPKEGDIGVYAQYSGDGDKTRIKRAEHSVQVSSVGTDGSVLSVRSKSGIRPTITGSVSGSIWSPSKGVELRYWTKKTKQ